MIDRLTGRHSQRVRRELPCTLVARESTGRPASGTQLIAEADILRRND